MASNLYFIRSPCSVSRIPSKIFGALAKKAIRENHYICESFKDVKKVFIETIEGKVFNFPKVYKYG